MFVFVYAQVSPPPTPPPEGDIANFRKAKIGLHRHFNFSNTQRLDPAGVVSFYLNISINMRLLRSRALINFVDW
jgi:hypothetical protein